MDFSFTSDQQDLRELAAKILSDATTLERTKQVRDPHEMGEKAVRLVREGRVRTVDGGDLELEVESICVHGDAPNAPEIARAIRDALERADIELAPLADLHTIAR